MNKNCENCIWPECEDHGVVCPFYEGEEKEEVYQRLIESKHDVIESAKRKKAMKNRQKRENK